jgi:TIR domain
MNIFISHTHEEFQVANAVKSELQRCFASQVDIFLAEEIPLGRNWFLEIRSALQKADLILALFSSFSRTRPWINIEAGFGIMSDKQVIPLCLPDLSKLDLPVVYALHQAMEIDNRTDIARLLEQIAFHTPARRLINDKATSVENWVIAMSKAVPLVPSYTPSTDDEPCVWILGSTHGMPVEQEQSIYKVVNYLAPSFVENRFRVVFGRSRLLSYLGDKITELTVQYDDQITQSRDVVSVFAAASAIANVNRPTPNPVLILGSLRSRQGLRRVFKDTIGRVPDVGVVIGGTFSGRVVEEVKLAQASNIPLLPLQFTGGMAERTESTFHESLNEEVKDVQNISRNKEALGKKVCDLIRKQVSISRSVSGM